MEIARYWRLQKQRYRMEGTRCNNCGTYQFPDKPVCPGCIPEKLESYKFEPVYPKEHFKDTIPVAVALLSV